MAMRYVIDDARCRFRSVFDTYVRAGIMDENGKDTGVNPYMASYPHLTDVGLMGRCIHGKTGVCAKAGKAALWWSSSIQDKSE